MGVRWVGNGAVFFLGLGCAACVRWISIPNTSDGTAGHDGHGVPSEVGNEQRDGLPPRDVPGGCRAIPEAKLVGSCPQLMISLFGTAGLGSGCPSPDTLTFTWAVKCPGGSLLSQFGGLSAAPAAGPQVTGGTFASPQIDPMIRQGNMAGHITIVSLDQQQFLWQRDFPLEPLTAYTLTFKAYSAGAKPIQMIQVAQNSQPSNKFGLNLAAVPLTTQWQTYSYPFTTNGLVSGQPTTDTRLRFELGGGPPTEFFFDDVRLVKDVTLSNVLGDPGLDAAGVWHFYTSIGGSAIFDRVEIESVVGGTCTVALTITSSGTGLIGADSTHIDLPACP
jgi:hypothetical protein